MASALARCRKRQMGRDCFLGFQGEKFKDDYNAALNSDERKFALKQQFSQFHHDFLQTASDEFDAFASRWLNNMPELDTEYVVTE